MNLNEIITQELNKQIDEKLPELVSQKTSKLINDILEDVFKSYSEMGKSIKKKIEESLDINLQQFDLVDYNAMVARAIVAELGVQVSTESIAPIKKLCRSVTGFVERREYKLSEVHRMAMDAAMDEDEDISEGEISFHIEINREYNWVVVNIDTEKNIPKEECQIEFIFSNKSHKRIFVFRSKEKWHSGNKRISSITPNHVANMNKLQLEIFRLYSAQVDMINDMDEDYIENSWSRYNY